MLFVARSVLAVTLLPTLVAIQSCTPIGLPGGTYEVDTFQFVQTDSNPRGEPPHIWIDTNTQLSSLSGGTMTSSLPCAVMIDFTDNSFSFEAASLTSVKITYNDGKVESSTASLELPLRIAAREYESVNSVAGGQIVKSKAWIISGMIPAVITRAEPFRLQMEGYFTRDDGSQLPFAVDQYFKIEREQAIKDAVEVLQDR